ncbi:hypothetical protein QR680_009211 [Steinernema hermaphroditum]|uniref:WW domain-containing protein n=1 Tax=Steinernema hermaphroditum TaxID=289476 RepID=A0AA39ILU7_9BILA|nr:hypothetical protein QR680_009211 [Steinernema hermaphroditum]
MAERDRALSSSSRRPRSVGSWTEHFSSSGKRYFYNHKTEVSQWEKPHEWRDHERAQLAANAASLNAHIQQSHHTHQEPGPSGLGSSGRAAITNAHLHHRRSHDRPAAAATGTPGPSRTSNPRIRKTSTSTASPKVVAFAASSDPAETSGSRNVASLECNQEEMPMDVDEESRDGDETETKPEVKQEEPKPLFSDDPITFDPEKYAAFLPKDFNLHRRNLVEHVESESVRAESKAFGIQTQIDRLSQDIKCSRSLVQTAHVKVALVDKRLAHVREDRKRLEEKKPAPNRSISTSSHHSSMQSSS